LSLALVTRARCGSTPGVAPFRDWAGLRELDAPRFVLATRVHQSRRGIPCELLHRRHILRTASSDDLTNLS